MSGRVPSTFDAPVTATSLVRPDSSARTLSTLSSAVSRSNPTHRSVAAAPSAACTHGRMFPSWSSRVTTTSSPGHPLLGERPGDVVRQLRHRPPEYDPSSIAPEQVRNRSPGADHHILSPPLGVRDQPSVGDPGRHRPRHRLGHLPRHLRPTRPIEVRDALVEGWEVPADALEVEGHDAIIAGQLRRGRIGSS